MRLLSQHVLHLQVVPLTEELQKTQNQDGELEMHLEVANVVLEAPSMCGTLTLRQYMLYFVLINDVL